MASQCVMMGQWSEGDDSIAEGWSLISKELTGPGL